MTQDLEELRQLLVQSRRENTRRLLSAEVARLEAKAKLSQNRTAAQAARAAAALQGARDPLVQETGRAMAAALEAET